MSSDSELDAMQKGLEDPHREIGLDDLVEILEKTIKYDRNNKVITFLICLGTYTDEEQSNVLFIAETTTGKSYIPLEILQYFPDDDVERVSYASPMSFFHKFGEYIKPTEEDKLKEDVEKEEAKEDGKKPRRKHSYIKIDMSKKIYIFKDMPSMQLLERLRSLLSHDEKTMEIQTTDKSEKSGYRTKHIKIIGYPTVIFCTATAKVFDPQESTRFFVLSPEIAVAKIEEAIKLLALRKGNKKFFHDTINGEAGRHFLKHRVELIKHENIYDVIIPNASEIAETFIKRHPTLNPRAMRDFGRLLGLIKYWAILNCFTRKSEQREEGKIIYADNIDTEIGFILYEAICTSNEMGLSPENYDIYKRIFEAFDKGNGLTKDDISGAYLKIFSRPLGNNRLNRDIIPNLMGSGLIYKDEMSGHGGKAQLYKLSKNIDVNAIQSNGGHTEPTSIKSLKEKMEYILGIFLPAAEITTNEIISQVKGRISNEKEVIEILNKMSEEGTIVMGKTKLDSWIRNG